MKNFPKSRRFIPYIDLVAVTGGKPTAFGLRFGRASFQDLRTGTVAASGHAHTNVEMNFMVSGAVTYLLGGRMQRLSAGELGIFWAAYPHQVSAAEAGSEMMWLTVPMEAFLSWELSSPMYRRLFGGELVVDARKNEARDRAFFEDHLRETLPAEVRENVALLEIQARILRLQANMRRAKGGAKGTGEKSFLSHGAVALAEHIATHFRDPLSLADIARAAGLHPSYAARLFRRAFGVTTGEFVAQTRVAHALAMLRTTDAQILDVALESGFQSSSRFYETFRKVTGRTPKDFRRRARSITSASRN